VKWPVATPQLSARDAARGMSFAQYRSQPIFE